jgi:endonuclease/exonuclease/phosphatase family metal-dependent hydrolase
MDLRKALDSRPAGMALDAILMFALLSALTLFVEATYVFGLLGTDIPPEIVYVLFLLSPFLLLLRPRLVDSRLLAIAAGGLGLVCWAACLPLGTRARMLLSGASCGLLLVSLVCRVRQLGRSSGEHAASIGSGVLLSALFRAFRSGNLLTSEGWSLAACATLAALGIALLVLRGTERAALPEVSAHSHRSLRSLGMSLGLTGALLIVYLGLSSPAVIARWGGVSYVAVMAVELGAAFLFFAAWVGFPDLAARLPRSLLLLWNLLFFAALACTLRLQQPTYGPISSYPVTASSPGALGSVLFWAALVLSPVIYADFGLLAAALRAEQPTPRGFVRGFAAGSLFLLLFAFCQVFTTVYDYIPVVGPAFRDRFWLVMAFPVVPLALAVVLLRRARSADPATRRALARWLPAAAIVAASTVLVAALSGAHPARADDRGSLRILTYNIQQGNSSSGEKSFQEQMELMRAVSPDILGLEETDTARAAGGNSDLVRFIADGLGMYSCYGPPPESGTFGVALLSRYPIRDARTFYLPSRGEQAAAIEARIAVGGRALRVIVTHLDNDGALPQQLLIIDSAVDGMKAGETVVLMGDLNFRTTTEQYRRTTAVLEDAWERSAERTVDPGAPDPATRIDHIFVTPGTNVRSARYLPRGLSDHPALLAEIAW